MAPPTGSTSKYRWALDTLIFVIVSLMAAGSYGGFISPTKRGFFCDDEHLKLPYKDDTVSTPVLLSVTIGAPLLVIFVHNWMCSGPPRSTRSYLHEESRRNTLKNKCYPVVKSNATVSVYCYVYNAVALLVGITKTSLGYQRPHFFDVCNPDMSTINCSSGFVTVYDCLGTHESRIKHAHMSFPSGHAAVSIYAAVFLFYYIEGMDTALWRMSRFIRSFVQLIVILLALFCCYSRVMDHKHHWWDVLAGGLIGLAGALLAIRVMSSGRKRKSSDCEQTPSGPRSCAVGGSEDREQVPPGLVMNRLGGVGGPARRDSTQLLLDRQQSDISTSTVNA